LELAEMGAVTGVSVGFDTEKAEWREIDGKDRYYILAINLWEISSVTFPANEEARVVAVHKQYLQRKAEDTGVVGLVLAAFDNGKANVEEMRAAIMEESGLTDAGLDDILNGETICPTEKVARGIARALGMEEEMFLNAANESGCSYNADLSKQSLDRRQLKELHDTIGRMLASGAEDTKDDGGEPRDAKAAEHLAALRGGITELSALLSTRGGDR